MTVVRTIAPAAKRVVAIVLAAVVACALCPGFAFASSLEAGRASSLSAQAAKKTVYVITEVKSSSTYDAGILGSVSVESTASYSYNGKGLVASHVDESNAAGAGVSTTFAYSGNKVESVTTTGGPALLKASYAYGANGRITKATTSSTAAAGSLAGSTNGTITPTYKAGKVKKLKSVDVAKAAGRSTTATTTAAYTYKKGRVSKMTSSAGVTRTYAYDAKGNIAKMGSVKYKNSYNAKGRLAKTVIKGSNVNATKTYRYMAMKVPASTAAFVEAQQWAIINENLNFAFGIAPTY